MLKTPSIFSAIALLTCLLLPYGCGETENGGNTQTTESAVRAPLDGIWMGEFDIGGKGPYDFTVLHLEGSAYAFSQHAKAMCIGTAKLDGENYISQYLLFELDGGPFDSATITGKFTEDNKITAQFVTLKGGDTGAMSLDYSMIYESPSSLAKTNGNWSYTDKENLTTELSVEEQGTILGHDSDGCDYLGYLDVINPDFNAYKVKLEITACGSVNGEYEGVSFITDEQLNMHITNEKYALYFAFNRKIESK